jgi:hypothetical protein
VGKLAEAASAHYIPGGGLVAIRRTEAGHGKVHVIEQVEELGAELNFHSLVDRQVFDSRQIDIKEARIRQQVAGSVAIRADGVHGEKRGVEILIHHLTV